MSGSMGRWGKISNVYEVLVIHEIYVFNNFLSSKLQIQRLGS